MNRQKYGDHRRDNGGMRTGDTSDLGDQTLTYPTSTAQTATYTVTPVGPSCTGSTFQLVVTVNPKPVVPGQATTICSGISPNYTPTNNPPTTIVPAGTLYTWTNPVVTEGITGGMHRQRPDLGQPDAYRPDEYSTNCHLYCTDRP